MSLTSPWLNLFVMGLGLLTRQAISQVPPSESCRRAPQVENGVLEIASLYPDFSAWRITCKSYYILVGSSLVTCTTMKGWSRIGKCVKLNKLDCRIPNISNGSFTITSDAKPGDPLVGSITCNRGYSLVGSATNNCNSRTGKWTYLGNCVLEDSIALVCDPSRLKFPNAYVDIFNESAGVGIVRCCGGYDLVGENLVTCSVGTNWSWRWNGNCIPNFNWNTVFCPSSLPGVDNGNVLPGCFEFGSKRAVICDEGYILQGPRFITCNHPNEGWSRPGRCIPLVLDWITESSTPLSTTTSTPKLQTRRIAKATTSTITRRSTTPITTSTSNLKTFTSQKTAVTRTSTKSTPRTTSKPTTRTTTKTTTTTTTTTTTPLTTAEMLSTESEIVFETFLPTTDSTTTTPKTTIRTVPKTVPNPQPTRAGLVVITPGQTTRRNSMKTTSISSPKSTAKLPPPVQTTTEQPSSPNSCGSGSVKVNSQYLIDAVRSMDEKEFHNVLYSNADANSRDPRTTWTALMWAAFYHRTQFIGELINCGADVNARSNVGNTPLMLAVQSRSSEAVMVLLENNADPNATNRYNSSALLIAAASGQVDIVNILLASGADITAKDNDGNTAVMLAVIGNHTEVVNLLLANGANPNTGNNLRQTPLMIAAKLGERAIIKALLSGRAGVDVKDIDGHSPISYASQGEENYVYILPIGG